MATQPTPNENIFELAIDTQSSSYLNDIARWAKFLSIVGFILCGMIIMGGMLAASFASDFKTSNSGARLVMTVFAIQGIFDVMIYIAIAVLSFFPYLYLYNFSTKMQVALLNNDQSNLHASFNNLRSCFKFVGILTIVILSFCVLLTIFVISASALFR